MAWFNRKRQQPIPSAAPSSQAPTAAYYAPGQICISHLDFDRLGPVAPGARVRRLDVGNLVGASVFESAVCSSSHVDALVFAELADSMQVIERKFHGGQYDAQAMPLVEAFLSELHTLAQIQVERNGIIDRRIADLRRANIMAYQAVCEERARREEGIDKARMYEWHSVAASYDRREAQMRRKQAKRLQHDEERAAKIEAKAQRTREKATQKNEAKTAREARSSAAKAVRIQRREDRNAAWQKLKQRRCAKSVPKWIWISCGSRRRPRGPRALHVRRLLRPTWKSPVPKSRSPAFRKNGRSRSWSAWALQRRLRATPFPQKSRRPRRLPERLRLKCRRAPQRRWRVPQRHRRPKRVGLLQRRRRPVPSRLLPTYPQFPMRARFPSYLQ